MINHSYRRKLYCHSAAKSASACGDGGRRVGFFLFIRGRSVSEISRVNFLNVSEFSDPHSEMFFA